MVTLVAVRWGDSLLNDESSTATALYSALERVSIKRIASLEISVVDVYLLDCEHDTHGVGAAVE